MEYRVKKAKTMEDLSDENYELLCENERLRSINAELMDYSNNVLSKAADVMRLQCDSADIREYLSNCTDIKRKDLIFYNILTSKKLSETRKKLNVAMNMIDDIISRNRNSKDLHLYNKVKKIKESINANG